MLIRLTITRLLSPRSTPLRRLLPAVLAGSSALYACGGGGSSTGTSGNSTTTTATTTTTTTTTATTTTGTGGMGGMGTTAGTGGTGGASTTTGTGGASTTAGTGGTGTTAGSGGAGGSMLCQPGSTMACYDGDAMTENVGLCHGGQRICAPDGQSYGGCMGQVLPVPETCNTPDDDDCNGVANDQGVGCACAPGTMAPCYTGPAGSDGKGPCKSGMQTCNALGNGYGACMGEVLPQAEDCATAVDENCDGLTPACPGTTLWAHVVGDTADDEANGVTTDPSGNIVVAAYGMLNPDFGCGPLAIGANYNAVLVKYSPTGTCLWNKTFKGSGANDKSEIKTVATDAAGNIYVGGVYFNGVNLGGGQFPNASVDVSDIFVGKFDPNGNHVWSKHFGALDSQAPKAIRVDSQGNVLLTGLFRYQLNFLGGCNNLVSGGNVDVFVTKLDNNGVCLWSKRYGDFNPQIGHDLAVDASNNVIVAGQFYGTLDFGGGNMLTSAGAGDVFALKLSPAGTYIWSKKFGDAFDQAAVGVTTDPGGDVVLVGTYGGTLDFGGGIMITSTDVYDTFVARLASDGTAKWATSGGGMDNQELDKVAVDPMGNIVTSGFLSGSGDFGGGILTSAGVQDALIVKYSAAGQHLWSRRFGGVGTEVGRAVAVDGTGACVMAGVGGPTDFGFGVQSGLGGEEMYVVKLAP